MKFLTAQLALTAAQFIIDFYIPSMAIHCKFINKNTKISSVVVHSYGFISISPITISNGYFNQYSHN